jgi:hypothetical protein
MYDDDETMAPGAGASASWFDAGTAVNGLDEGAATLAGTSVVADEVVGEGRVISFAIDPNFRGWTMGTHRLLWNALLGPDPSAQAASPAERRVAVRVARSAARDLPRVGASPLRIGVSRADARVARAAIRDWGATSYRGRASDGGALLLVPNLDDLSSEEHTFVELLRALETAGVQIRWASVP